MVGYHAIRTWGMSAFSSAVKRLPIPRSLLAPPTSTILAHSSRRQSGSHASRVSCTSFARPVYRWFREAMGSGSKSSSGMVHCSLPKCSCVPSGSSYSTSSNGLQTTATSNGSDMVMQHSLTSSKLWKSTVTPTDHGHGMTPWLLSKVGTHYVSSTDDSCWWSPSKVISRQGNFVNIGSKEMGWSACVCTRTYRRISWAIR